MLFNSLHFLIYLPIVLIISNLLKDRNQRMFLLLASFYFYMAWNMNFIWLLLFSTLIDYFAGISISKLDKSDKKRKYYLILSLVTNLGFLSYFKYTNFYHFDIYFEISVDGGSATTRRLLRQRSSPSLYHNYWCTSWLHYYWIHN